MLNKLLIKKEVLEKEIFYLQEDLKHKIIKYELLNELVDELEKEAQPVEEVQPQEEAVEANPIY